MNIPCFLIPVIVGLICALLGYLLGKMMSGGKTVTTNNFVSTDSSSLQTDLDACRANSAKLSATISSLHTELDLLKAKHSSAQSFVAVTETLIPFDADLAASVYGKKIIQDDFQ